MECANLTEVLSWTDIPAAGATFLILVWVFLHYQLKQQELRSKERMNQKNGITPPPAD